MRRRPADMFLDNFAAIPLGLQRELLDPRVGANDPYEAPLRNFDRTNGASGMLDRLLYTDIKTYLVELLMKQDQMSMSTSIESRVPFLDHVLVEFASRLPRRFKLRHLTTKWILREAVKGIIPPDILSRPKMGFPVPFAAWMRRGWNSVARDVLLDRRTRERGLTDTAAVMRLLNDHQAGRSRAGDAIWSLLNLELWYRTFIDGCGVQTLPDAGERALAAAHANGAQPSPANTAA
jgi:asparagine synthase (glutamine-hydrolysing)